MLIKGETPYQAAKETTLITAVFVYSGIAHHKLLRKLGHELPTIGGMTAEEILGFPIEKKPNFDRRAMTLCLSGFAGIGALRVFAEGTQSDMALMDAVNASVAETGRDLFGSE